jgi:glutamate-1-semialdehyde 2,1-aminomutase
MTRDIQRSRDMLQQSRRYLAGGVSSNVRLSVQPPPLFFERGNGSHLQDVDGNDYVDYVLGQGPMMLGHTPQPVIDTVQKAVGRGQLFGGQHDLEIKVAQILCEHIPCAELVRFCSSGSEAVQGAIRVARAMTGRQKIVKFEGHYHGWFDNVLISFHPTLEQAGPANAPAAVAGSSGQASSAMHDAVILPWNDLSAVERALAQHGHDIAAVIMEPMMCNTGAIPPAGDYLAGVRDLCRRYGVVLIFDEIITGFRLGLTSAQGLFGVTPDLAVFGKAIASGFPVACLAGRHDYMQGIAEGRIVHAGTYNSNVVCMAATLATLQELTRNEGAVYDHIYALGDYLMAGLRASAQRRGSKILIQGFGPVFHVGFTDRASVTDYRTALSYDEKRYLELVETLLACGVRVTNRGVWYVSAAHTRADADATIAAFDEALGRLSS